MQKSLLICFALLFTPLATADMRIEVQIPRLDVAEYHRPYVALWIEQEQRHVADITVWYDLGLADQEGEKWLKDLRQWWRRSGRGLTLPVDGISAATRPPGIHELTLGHNSAPLNDLPPGDYELLVEAAREVGGRELLRLPFSWPASQASTVTVQGTNELGQVRLALTP
ncbi:MAG: DUF2271 domain-containing protein [Gammaproteobacteria bacterium HGW-Gammaproteobacteria-6]|nr:MAG: DUF2271 domain-containing protein [Gammaproteobacteria bacterium HGW-Gammaproteobacteria-6]